MRLRHHSGRTVHLSLGVDLRPARDLRAVVDLVDAYAAVARARLGVGVLGVHPWLPPDLAAALAVDARSRARLRTELTARGLEVVTLCGNPYADPRGDAPDEPDWSDPARLEYTLDLARVLVDLLPDDAVRGAVTTVGLGRREGWDSGKEKSCARILGRLSAGLAEVAWQHGRAVRVGFQPGPGRVLDGADQVVAAFARTDRERLGVNLDLAGLACTWEDPAGYLDRLAAGGVAVIRARIGAVVEAADPAAAAPALRRYVEPGHPHPVTNPEGGYVPDLADALDLRPPGPWRVRLPVPLHTPPPAPLGATTDVWRAALRHLTAGDLPGTEYLGVEGTGGDPGGPAAELAYARAELTDLGLVPEAPARAAC